MKKIFATIFTLLIASSLVALTGVKAESVNLLGSKVEGTDYVQIERESKQVIKSFDFEEDAEGISTQWGTMYREVAIPFSGTGSYYACSTDTGYPQSNFYIAGNTAYRTAGTYYVEFDVKPTAGVYGVLSGIDMQWDSMLTEFGVTFGGLTDGIYTTAEMANIGGWLGAGKENYQNGSVTYKENGVFHCYYEFVLTGSEAFSGDFSPLVWFKTRITTTEGDHYALYDNIAYGKVMAGEEVTTVVSDWNVDYESFDEGTDPGNSQPVWGGSVATVGSTKALKLTAAAGADNANVAGLENRDGDYLYKKFIKADAASHVEYDVKTEGLSMFNMWTSGTYTAVIYNGEAWHSEGAVTNFTATANENGFTTLSYDLPEAAYSLTFSINVSSTDGGAAYIDNFKVSHNVVTTLPLTDQYFTVDHEVDYAEIAKNNATPWGVQPVWANSGDYATDWWEGETALKLSGATNTNDYGDTLGGFEQRAGYANKLIKAAGLNYIQMDLGLDNISMLNIFTGPSFYTAVIYKDGAWHAEGYATNLKVTEIEDGYRISYYINFPEASMNEDVKINAKGTGSVYINNLIVAHEDYAPFAADASYNMVNTEDVTVKYSLKEAEFVALNDAEGNAVSADMYSMNEGVLTLKKELFASGAESYAFALVSKKGSRSFTVSKNDNRTVVTASLKDAVSKVYDGTADYADYELVLEGVKDGDNVTVSGTLSLSSADAGDVTVTVSDLVLSGDNAAEYVLSATSFETTGEITKKAITVTADRKEKNVGEADPELTYTVEGLVGSDTLSGALTRVAGEEAGQYEIQLGTLTAGGNYEIGYVSNELNIIDNTPDPDPTPDEPTTDAPTTDAPVTDEPTTKEDVTTTAEEVTTTKEESTTTEEKATTAENATSAKKSGCGSMISSLVFIPMIALGACLAFKRKENE